MNKCYAVLCMCEDLMKEKTLTIENCLAEYAISVPTFRRYISLLRMYFAERHSTELIYDKNLKGYRLEKNGSMKKL